jgi:hypothetical protein
MIRTAESLDISESGDTLFDDTYGVIEKSSISYHLPCIGYLARSLLDQGNNAEGQAGVDYLRRRLQAQTPDTNRDASFALATGLGLLGEWEPILTHLGPGEPWVHDTAQNVFRHWVPGPLAEDPQSEAERAACWIARRLWFRGDLAPDVRSTLETILDSLERTLGRRIARDELSPETSE